MADENVPEAQAVPSPEPQPEKDRLATLEEKFSKFDKKLDYFLAQSRVTTKTEPSAAQAPAGEGKSLDQQFAEFRAQRDADLAEIATERRDNAIVQHINDLGLSGEDAKMFKAYVEAEYGRNISADDEDKKKIVYKKADKSVAPLSELMTDVFKQVGKRFQPPKALPSQGVPSGVNGVGGSASHPFAALTYKDIMNHKRGDLRATFIKEHNEDFQRKKRESR